MSKVHLRKISLAAERSVLVQRLSRSRVGPGPEQAMVARLTAAHRFEEHSGGHPADLEINWIWEARGRRR